MDLKELRIKKGLTQAEAASIAGVGLDSYKNHELGRSKLDSPLGKMIYSKVESYEPYSFDKGILPIELIEEKVAECFRDKEIDFAYLFGSYAKGNAGSSSDVDFLIFGKITGLAYFSLGGKLEKALCKKVDVLRFQDVSSNDELIAEIMATGICIYGDTPNRLDAYRKLTTKNKHGH